MGALKCSLAVSTQKVGEMIPFGTWEPVSPVPEEGWLLSSQQKPSCIQAELISGYLDCPLGFGELEVPLDLTVTK